FVVLWRDREPRSRRCAPELAFLNDQLAGLHYVARRCEHDADIVAAAVDRHISVGPGTQVAFGTQAKQPGGRGAGDDRDLVQGVFASESIQQRAPGEQAEVYSLELLVPIGPIHQQADQLGVGEEGSSIGMIGGEHHAPWVGGKQKELETYPPLECRDGRLLPVRIRNDAAAAFQLYVYVHPFAPAARVQEVLHRAVRRNGGGGAEHHLPHVHADFGVLIDVLDEFWRGGAPAPGRSTTGAVSVGMELEMGEMSAPASQGFHALQRHSHISRPPQVVAVNVNRMGKAQPVPHISQRLENAPGRDVAGPYSVVEPVDITATILPLLDTAWVHDLDRVAAGPFQQPRRVVPSTRRLAGGYLAQQEVIVAQQDEESRVNARRVVQLEMGVEGAQGSHRRVKGCGIAQPRVAVTGRECARDSSTCAGARAVLLFQEPRCWRRIPQMFFGQETSRVIAA